MICCAFIFISTMFCKAYFIRLYGFSNAYINRELDNWVPAKACQELVESMIDEGVNIKINVLKDAHHSFDRTTPVVKVEDAYNFSECRLRMNDEGSVLMNYLNVPMNSPLLQKIGLFLCAQRGSYSRRTSTFKE